MPTKEEMITKIYEEIGTKHNDHRNDLSIYATLQLGINKAGPVMQCIVDKYHEYHKAKLMLGDIIHYANVTVSNLTKDFDYTSEIEEIELKLCRHFAGHHAGKPIDEQTEECVKYVREEVCKQS